MTYKKKNKFSCSSKPFLANRLIRNLGSGVFLLGIVIPLQGCVLEAAFYAITAVDAAVTVGSEEQGGPWSIHPACHLECVSSDGETSVIRSTGLSDIGVQTCFSSNEQHYLSVEYCDRWLNKYCERAAAKLAQEDLFISHCSVAQTSECVDFGIGRFPECETIRWVTSE